MKGGLWLWRGSIRSPPYVDRSVEIWERAWLTAPRKSTVRWEPLRAVASACWFFLDASCVWCACRADQKRWERGRRAGTLWTRAETPIGCIPGASGQMTRDKLSWTHYWMQRIYWYEQWFCKRKIALNDFAKRLLESLNVTQLLFSSVC